MQQIALKNIGEERDELAERARSSQTRTRHGSNKQKCPVDVISDGLGVRQDYVANALDCFVR